MDDVVLSLGLVDKYATSSLSHYTTLCTSELCHLAGPGQFSDCTNVECGNCVMFGQVYSIKLFFYRFTQHIFTSLSWFRSASHPDMS